VATNDPGVPLTTGLRFLIELPEGDRRGLQQIGAALETELGPGWPVSHLFPRPRTRDLNRFFVTWGQVPASPAYPMSALAYDLARGLGDRLHAVVEPDLPSSAYRQDGADSGVGPRAVVADEMLVAETGLAAAAASANDKHWSVNNVRAPEAWDMAPQPGGAARGAGILVGHIDTGYTEHPEIYPDALNLTIDRDVLDGDDDAKDPLIKRWWFPLDNPGHGTGTSCVIASRSAGQVVGTAPEAVLVPIRSVLSVVQVFDGDVARAVDYARSVGCSVISMSLGGRGFNGLQAAIKRAVDDGMIVMAAAGNYVGFVSAPASYPECLAVAATNVDDQPWSGSSRGAQVDISAPGEAVWTAATNKGPSGPVYTVEQGNGTSFAVAALAGIAALWLAHHGPAKIKQKYGGMTQEVFRLLVTLTCRTPQGWDGSRYGAGIVDAKALLDAALPEKPALALAAGADTAGEATVDHQGPLGQLAATWSDRSVADIERSLSAKLGGVAAADGAAPLARYASELRYLAGEDPLLHQALVPPPAELTEGLATAVTVQESADRLVRSGVSRDLATMLTAAVAQ
jgi:subtilisin family serine protease